MNLDHFLLFLMKHNTTIIEVLIAVTLIFIVFIAFRSFLAAKEPESTASLSGLGDLEETLKKIVAQASQISTVPSTESSQKLIDEIETLKSSLQEKQLQIEEMKIIGANAGADPAPGMSSAEREKIEAQLQELQAKLSEYEIISEDIADLSLYKEQNAKLKEELAALKAQKGKEPGPSASAAPSEAIVPPEPAVAPEPDPVAVAMAAEPEIVEPEAVPPPAEESIVAPEADSSSAMSSSSTPESGTAIQHVVDDDLMAAFGEAVEKQQTNIVSDSASVDLGSLDVDQVMKEAVAIETNVPDIDPEQALGLTLDEAKILEEAKDLEKGSVADVSLEDKKLMGQFEDFVKKNE